MFLLGRFTEGRIAVLERLREASQAGYVPIVLMAPLPALGLNFEIGPGGVQVHPHGFGDCGALRAACMHKEELGESGQ